MIKWCKHSTHESEVFVQLFHSDWNKFVDLLILDDVKIHEEKYELTNKSKDWSGVLSNLTMMMLANEKEALNVLCHNIELRMHSF